MGDTLQADEVKDWTTAHRGWKYRDDAIHKEFAFQSFRDSIVFVNRIASIADELDHHPDINVRYDKVLLSITTHSAGGVTTKDLSLAERIDFATSAR